MTGMGTRATRMMTTACSASRRAPRRRRDPFHARTRPPQRDCAPAPAHYRGIRSGDARADGLGHGLRHTPVHHPAHGAHRHLPRDVATPGWGAGSHQDRGRNVGSSASCARRKCMRCEVPLMPLSGNDLQAMVAIVTAYRTYLRHGVLPSPKRERSLQLLQGLERRLTPLVAAPQGQEELVIPLTTQEIQVLEEAMDGFVQVVCQLIPPSNQRDELLQEIKSFRDYLHRALTAQAGA